MQRGFWIAVLTACGLALAQTPIDPAQHGFSQVVASVVVQPWDYLRLGLGGAIFTVPDKAFGPDPVRFELLVGDPGAWQKYAPAGQKVVYAFALRVTDLKTGERVVSFKKPLHFSYYGTEIAEKAGYWNVTLSDPPQVTSNPVKPSIRVYRLGKRHHTGWLAHPIAETEEGWLITVPQ